MLGKHLKIIMFLSFLLVTFIICIGFKVIHDIQNGNDQPLFEGSSTILDYGHSTLLTIVETISPVLEEFGLEIKWQLTEASDVLDIQIQEAARALDEAIRNDEAIRKFTR